MEKKPNRIEMFFIYKQAVYLSQGYRSHSFCVWHFSFKIISNFLLKTSTICSCQRDTLVNHNVYQNAYLSTYICFF